MKKTYIVIFALCFIEVVTLFVYFNRGNALSSHFTKSNKLLPANPMIGYAPMADSDEVKRDDISLAYVEITWAELEPREGVFDLETIETKNNIQELKKSGKHLVFRFVLDVPTDNKHMDIPNWLYDKINGDGTWYDIDYGKGFSPNYNNDILISYHEKAVKAIGKRWGNDSFIAYIELGSLGHWGEWHVDYSNGMPRLPQEEVRAFYISPYIKAFPQAKFLMRRPFNEAKKYGFGVYNDLVGDAKSTKEWLGWLNNGGSYEQPANEEQLAPRPNWWEEVPVGGEFTSALSFNNMFVENLDRTIELIKESHTSFIGPKYGSVNEDYKNSFDKIRENLGYRFFISSAEIIKDSSIKLTWENLGIAPMYFNFDTYIYVENKSGDNIATVKVPIDLTSLQSETSQEIVVDMGKITLDPNTQNIYLGIVDPMTGKDAVHFAVKGQEFEKRLLLFKKNRGF